jgi:sugar phosphate isomerase/epimerase
LNVNPLLRRETASALADSGVGLWDIELARIVEGQDPRGYLSALEVGAALGAKHVLTSIWTPNQGFAVEAFGVLCDLAKPLGLTVNLEFVAWANCSTLGGALDVVRTANRTNAGIMIDTFHFHHAGDTVESLVSVPPEWFHYVHVSDDRIGIGGDLEETKRRGREERVYPGEGVIDIAGILNHLPERVVCAIELPHQQRLSELRPLAYTRECLKRTKRYLKTSNRARSADLNWAGGLTTGAR